MSLLYSVIFATRCRSNHHRLAVDALRFLDGPDAEAWRTLLLHHHDQYLKGAKAPDDVFKDFKNHVLHVRDGEWGGAIEAAEEWRKRTVRALKEKDWPHVAWCAGVMSHYVVDPHQPFHTHQTEEENSIHRAVEQSFSKSYGAFQALLEKELGGYPTNLTLSSSEDWVGDFVREGAKIATQSYETVVDHYNFAVGVKRPAEGLDQTIRLAIAPLVGRAVIGWARILQRMFAEAGVKPPNLDGGLQAFFLALEAPIQAVLKQIGDTQERQYVAAQYEEFRRTGKVRSKLSDDDATVRALYAAEVLKAPLSSLDARWPREIGALHAPATKAKAKSKKAAPAARAKPDQAKPAQAQPVQAKAAVAQKPEKIEAAPVKEISLEAQQEAAQSAQGLSPFFNPATPPAHPQAEAPQEPAQDARVTPIEDAPALAPPVEEAAAAPLLLTKKVVEKKSKKGAAEGETHYLLRGESPIVDAPSIGPKTAKRLNAIGLRTVSDLLAISPATAAVLIDAKHINAADIADWQAEAMLACTLPNLKSREAQALVACDMASAEILAKADAKKLGAALRAWCTGPSAQRIWGSAEAPSDAEAASFIERAKAAAARAPKSAA
ncbi:MAG: DUF4332 domain-containing protein [Hyphomonadaceae bacterium]